ncbi:MAG: 23S rRNA (pseudouridine(1915)-N(3))-methyltransferase RlmH [Acidobacteriota bacterium]
MLRFVWSGPTRHPAYAALEVEYLERIQRLVPARREVVAEEGKRDPRARAAALRREAAELLRRVGDQSRMVLLHPEGRRFTSEEFSAWLGTAVGQGGGDLCFVGAGPWGTDAALVERADVLLSLSALTLPHELARVVLLEQVYRGLAILRGHPYHK